MYHVLILFRLFKIIFWIMFAVLYCLVIEAAIYHCFEKSRNNRSRLVLSLRFILLTVYSSIVHFVLTHYCENAPSCSAQLATEDVQSISETALRSPMKCAFLIRGTIHFLYSVNGRCIFRTACPV